ncbi:unnamed protein product [Dicrocoelium dendriticum]|nr:unnamed protein product [Dicrocoelium dendriticum]
MSRMRLVAAQAWLKLAHSQSYVENIEVDWYQSMTYIICDPCPQVRSRFLMKLNQGLYRLRLPLEYMAMFAHAADVPDSAFKQRAKQFLHGNIQRRRDFLNRHPSYLKDAKFLYGLLPDFVLPYLIYLLAHDPQWSHPYDVNRLNRVKASLWFVMEPVVTRGHNFVFLRKIIEKIKHTRDALAPDNALMNMKLYITCDIALGLLLTRSSDLTIKEYPVDVKLPKTLFCAAPSDFKNPDFAQLLGPAIEHTRTHAGTSNGETIGVRQPLIQFTPSKSARLLKDALMPAELLKERRQGATALKTSAVDSTSVDPSLPPNAGKPGHSTANASQLPRDRHVLEPNEVDSSAILTDNEIPRSIDLDEVPDPNLTTQSSSRSIPTTQSTISSAQSSVDKRTPAPKLEPHAITGCGRKRKRRRSSADVTLKNLLKSSPKKSSKTAAAPGVVSSPATMQSKKNVRIRHASQSTHLNTSITTVSRKTTPGSNLPGVKKNNQLSADNSSTRLCLRKSDSQPSVKKRGRTPISADPKRPKLGGPSTLEIGRKVSRRSSQSKPSRTSNMTRGRKK